MLQGRIVLIFEKNGTARVELDPLSVRNPIAVVDRFVRARFGKLIQLEQRRLSKELGAKSAPKTPAATLTHAANQQEPEKAQVVPVAPPAPPERAARAVSERLADLRRKHQAKRSDGEQPTITDVQLAETKVTEAFLSSHKQAPPVHPELGDLERKLKDRGVDTKLEERANG